MKNPLSIEQRVTELRTAFLASNPSGREEENFTYTLLASKRPHYFFRQKVFPFFGATYLRNNSSFAVFDLDNIERKFERNAKNNETLFPSNSLIYWTGEEYKTLPDTGVIGSFNQKCGIYAKMLANGEGYPLKAMLTISPVEKDEEESVNDLDEIGKKFAFFNATFCPHSLIPEDLLALPFYELEIPSEFGAFIKPNQALTAIRRALRSKGMLRDLVLPSSG